MWYIHCFQIKELKLHQNDSCYIQADGELIGKGNCDTFMQLKVRYEDPFPISENHFLVSKSIQFEQGKEKKWAIIIILVNYF